MEKRIRALKAIILVVVMIVELFGVDAVRVVAETINVTGDTTISTEDNRDYAVTDCTLTVSSTGNITGTVYGSGGKIVNQGSISKIERNIEVDNQLPACSSREPAFRIFKVQWVLRMPDILHPRHIVRHTL